MVAGENRPSWTQHPCSSSLPVGSWSQFSPVRFRTPGSTTWRTGSTPYRHEGRVGPEYQPTWTAGLPADFSTQAVSQQTSCDSRQHCSTPMTPVRRGWRECGRIKWRFLLLGTSEPPITQAARAWASMRTLSLAFIRFAAITRSPPTVSTSLPLASRSCFAPIKNTPLAGQVTLSSALPCVSRPGLMDGPGWCALGGGAGYRPRVLNLHR